MQSPKKLIKNVLYPYALSMYWLKFDIKFGNRLYIQKRRGEPGLFSFEYNLLPKLTSNFYALHVPGISLFLTSFQINLYERHLKV